MCATCASRSTSGPSTSTVSFGPPRRRLNPFSRRQRRRLRSKLYVAEMGWMNPTYGELRNALSTSEMSEAQRRQVKLNIERARALPAGQWALHRRQCRRAAPLHVRRRPGRRFDARGRRQAQISNADDGGLCPLREPQSLLVRAARPRRGADRSERAQAGRELPRSAWLSGRRRTSSTIRRSSILP